MYADIIREPGVIIFAFIYIAAGQVNKRHSDQAQCAQVSLVILMLSFQQVTYNQVWEYIICMYLFSINKD